MLRAVIFDFDGLILDTEMPDFVSWREIYAAHGQVLERETWVQGVGTRNGFDPYACLEERIGRSVDRDAIRAIRRPRFTELLRNIPLLDGVEACLQEARALGLRVGLASSSNQEWVMPHLARVGLTGRFDALVFAGDGTPAKPDPAVYLCALAELQVPASVTLALEDSPNGIAAAKAAGLACIAVPNPITARLDLSAADRVVASLAQLSLRHVANSWPGLATA